ncbi:hypothetical protein CEXT_596971 [Caerostris extrusa]|uniref:Uncharacterized protein n=1 Tax=Caerostris extrusa TaxID=172846 RepID=A0AAV4UI52_CAEEX|nr:hypothetical protein CEXT_596971 [Caerostris extrusa]
MQMNARAISCRRTLKKDIGRETNTKNVHTLQLPLTSPRMDWHPHHHITEGRRHVLKLASKTVDSRKNVIIFFSLLTHITQLSLQTVTDETSINVLQKYL